MNAEYESDNIGEVFLSCNWHQKCFRLIKKLSEMKANDKTVASMRPAKTFNDNQAPINSLDFSADGLQMISSSDDDSIIMYDCISGQKSRSFAHNTSNAIHCSTKVDGNKIINRIDCCISLDVIRYLSLHDNKYIRYFPGHQKKVVTLCMSPLDDMFLSGSLDKTIRLWDLRIQSCQGLMHVPSRPVAAFDPEGLIFAAGINSDTIKLYDLRSFDKGPFTTFKVENEAKEDWTGLKFSPDGKMIMITTNGSSVTLIDSFKGTLVHVLRGHENSKGIELDATFCADAQYVFSGSTDSSIVAWSVTSGQRISKLASGHSPLIHKILFNPRFFMLATACTTLNLWLPTEE
ncbi:WD repeat-containing protein 82 [Dirofilaria immitis]|nr:WD repeat-containing protein 82 [Dirofilaria immitis]